jgi:DNA-binding transcriptional ArsR family regulator
VTATIRAEFDISQPAVSQHLKVLRENGFATVRADGTRRLYAIDPAGMSEVDQWLDRFRGLPTVTPPEEFWNQRLDALATELARGRRAARQADAAAATRQPAAQQRAPRQRPPRQRAAKTVRETKETA